MPAAATVTAPDGAEPSPVTSGTASPPASPRAPETFLQGLWAYLPGVAVVLAVTAVLYGLAALLLGAAPSAVVHRFAFAAPEVVLAVLAVPVLFVGVVAFTDSGRLADWGGWVGNAVAVYAALALLVLAARGAYRLDRVSDVYDVLQGEGLAVSAAADGRDWYVTFASRRRPPVDSLFGRQVVLGDSLVRHDATLDLADALRLQRILASSPGAGDRRLAQVLGTRLLASADPGADAAGAAARD